jgi:GNAT superfamily N-acetyltransferase
MLIREIEKKEELIDVLELLRELSPDEEINVNTSWSTWKEMQQYPYYKLFAAIEDGRIVGTFCLMICCNLGHASQKFAILENVVVASGLRGTGIGKAMIKDALNRAKEENCYKLSLSSNFKRLDAHLFYENIGFKQHGLSFLMETYENS